VGSAVDVATGVELAGAVDGASAGATFVVVSLESGVGGTGTMGAEFVSGVAIGATGIWFVSEPGETCALIMFVWAGSALTTARPSHRTRIASQRQLDPYKEVKIAITFSTVI
jgi:hypothetical protein